MKPTIKLKNENTKKNDIKYEIYIFYNTEYNFANFLNTLDE